MGYKGTVVLIGASTGGVDALLNVLAAATCESPPVVVAQHTRVGYGEGLSETLGRNLAVDVVLARSGMPLSSGKVAVVAGLHEHMVFQDSGGLSLVAERGGPVNGHRPSIDVLFRSAIPFACNVTAALLTGMGNDGACGLFELRRAGASTIAQDEATSIVFGMPRVAAEMGAANLVLPLQDIGKALFGRTPVTGQPAGGASIV